MSLNFMRFNRKSSLISGILVLLAIVSIVLFLVWGRENDSADSEISSFDECVEAGYPVMESYPRQCAVPDGETFIEELDEDNDKQTDEGQTGGKDQVDEICANLCGDGICQRIVCMAEGCPCAETEESCPDDCGAGEENVDSDRAVIDF